jgi:serine/threonine-protein kinase
VTDERHTSKGSKQQIPGYQLLEKLGSGGMATVYKARQLSLDRVVAIKVLSHRLTDRPGYVERFYAEGRIAAKLNDPNIVTALDVGEANGHHYFVMEYVQGQTVYDRLVDIGDYDEEEAVNIMLQVARALRHAHEVGLIHRDVKPQNIMLTPQGTAKLADLGLARAADDVGDEPPPPGKQRTVFGSPYYIAPEQILHGDRIDFRADLYSFGATFFYMLTGQVPFDAPSVQDVLKRHVHEPLTPPHTLSPRISQEVSQVIQVCMAKEPAGRYETTSDLVDDLESIAAGGAPLKAGMRLDLKLVAEESESPRKPAAGPATVTAVEVREPGLLAEKSFWLAVVGWIVALVFATLWLSTVLLG